MVIKNIMCAALLVLPGLVLANDGIGSVKAGGIEFRKSATLAMKKEVLNVSYDKISVDYDFVNESAAPVSETIVFPLPQYGPAYGMSNEYFGQPGNFSILVDGRAVAFRTVVEATLDGKDVSAGLKAAGLTEEQIAYYPLFSPFDKKVMPLTAAQQRQLIAQKLLAPWDGDGDWIPEWKVRINYVWRQTFLPHIPVHVRHQYAPFVAAGPGQWDLGERRDFVRNYCADPAFFSAWQRAKMRTEGQSMVPAVWVSYILKTGNTWKNGIEDFTLNLIKKRPDELISLCFPGTFVKIDATTLQVRLRNFQPKQNLEVYFGNVVDSQDNAGVTPVIQ